MSTMQEADMNNELCLSSLPSDIIRKTIRFAQLSVDELKLISPLWNSLTQEHLRNRSWLPAMKNCLWHFNYAQTTVFLGILDPLRDDFILKNPSKWQEIRATSIGKYFGVHKWPVHCYPNERSDPPPSLIYQYEYPIKSGRLLADTGKEVAHLKNVFARSSKVEKLSINVIKHDRALKTAVKNVIGPVKIDELCFTGIQYSNDDDCEIILDFARFNVVQCLSLSIFDVDRVETSGTFFIEAARLASTVKFYRFRMIFSHRDLAEIRAEWTQATAWLNQTGQLTAVLKELYLDNAGITLCIEITKKDVI